MSAYSTFQKYYLNLSLSPIHVRELFFLHNVPCDIYAFRNKIFEIDIKKHTPITKELLKDLMENQKIKLFVDRYSHDQLREAQQNNLRTISRSLSIGDPLVKGRKQLNLLTLNMRYLYDNPNHDATLSLQYQGIKNLCLFLLENLEIHSKLYYDYMKSHHHYVFAQPLISSLFLVGILKQSHQFSNKEIETLFVTSYFKDIGMSAVATEKYNLVALTDADRKIFLDHPGISVQILQGRIPLGPTYLKIIRNHHTSSLLKDNHDVKDVIHDEETENKTILGFETVVITVLDIIAAMITGRPFRKPTNLFEALELARKLIADEYPQEFKLIVNYFKQIFKT